MDVQVEAPGNRAAVIGGVAIAVVLLFVALLVVVVGRSPGSESRLQGGDDFSVLGALAEVPVGVLGDVHQGATIVVGDIESATSIARLDRPSLADGDEVRQNWFRALHFPHLTLGPSGRPVFVSWSVPHLHVAGGDRTYDEFDRQMGWSLFDVDAFVAVQAPQSITVVSGQFGDHPFAGSEVLPLSGGVMTLGDGPDFEVDLQNTTSARPLGRPKRTAHQDGRIAVSTSTDLVSAWLNPSSTLAEQQSWAAVGEAFDAEDVMSAVIQPTSSWVEVAGLSPDQAAEVEAQLAPVAINEPFDLVGLGWASRGDELVGIMVWHFGDDAVASRQADRITRMFDEGRSVVTNEPITEYVTVDDVSAVGPVVVATLSFPPEVGPRPQHLRTWLDRRDLPAFYID